jgi:hypothetical protein
MLAQGCPHKESLEIRELGENADFSRLFTAGMGNACILCVPFQHVAERPPRLIFSSTIFVRVGGRSGFSLGSMAGTPLLRAPGRRPVSDVSLPRFPRSLNAKQARAAIPNEVSMFTGNALLG